MAGFDSQAYKPTAAGRKYQAAHKAPPSEEEVAAAAAAEVAKKAATAVRHARAFELQQNAARDEQLRDSLRAAAELVERQRVSAAELEQSRRDEMALLKPLLRQGFAEIEMRMGVSNADQAPATWGDKLTYDVKRYKALKAALAAAAAAAVQQ